MSSTDSEDSFKQSYTSDDTEELSLSSWSGNQADLFPSASSGEIDLGDHASLPTADDELDKPVEYYDMDDGIDSFSTDANLYDTGQDIFSFGNPGRWEDGQPNSYLFDDSEAGSVAELVRKAYVIFAGQQIFFKNRDVTSTCDILLTKHYFSTITV